MLEKPFWAAEESGRPRPPRGRLLGVLLQGRSLPRGHLHRDLAAEWKAGIDFHSRHVRTRSTT